MLLHWLFLLAGLVSIYAQSPVNCYGIIFDAGSSGTRAYVYNWPCRTKNSTPKVHIADNAPNQQIRGGIASYANATEAAASLIPLLSYVASIVPSSQKSYTPIFLRATAGMRLLPSQQQDNILNAIRKYFRTTGYRFDNDSWVKVISGDEEGAFGWVAVNYLYNNIDASVPADKTNTVLDCGGASTQITFSQPTGDSSNSFTVSFQDIKNYTLYTHSYLGYGNDQARKGVAMLSNTSSGLIVSPCFQTGFNGSNVLPDELRNLQVVGSGNFTACRALVREYLQLNDSCTDCSIQGNEQPDVPETSTISGLNSYVFLADILGLGEQYTLNNLTAAATAFCNMTWDDAKKVYTSNFLALACFQATLLVEMTQNGFRVDPNRIISAKSSVGNVTVAWTLGAILYDISSSNCSPGTELCYGSDITFVNPIYYAVPIAVTGTLVILIVVAAVIIFLVYRHRKLKAQYMEVDLTYHEMEE